uniref:Uncharacterized protein n=1 Tax=Gopherus evgoodei TaxID=1825980 RepID=A0A8C4YM19_9SAUR
LRCPMPESTWSFSMQGYNFTEPLVATTDFAPSCSLPTIFPFPDAFLFPGSFPRTPKLLVQDPISLLTLEKQYLHPRAL